MVSAIWLNRIVMYYCFPLHLRSWTSNKLAKGTISRAEIKSFIWSQSCDKEIYVFTLSAATNTDKNTKPDMLELDTQQHMASEQDMLKLDKTPP